MTEAAGIPVGLEVAGANRHDMKLVAATLASVPPVIEDKRLLHLATCTWQWVSKSRACAWTRAMTMRL